MSEALARCPFCGSADIKVWLNAAQCVMCGASGPENDAEQGSDVVAFTEKARRDWNTRAPDPRIAAAKALAEACEPLAQHCAEEDIYETLLGREVTSRIRDARAALLKALEAGDA